MKLRNAYPLFICPRGYQRKRLAIKLSNPRLRKFTSTLWDIRRVHAISWNKGTRTLFIYIGAGGGIRTHEPLQDRLLKPTPLTRLGDPCTFILFLAHNELVITDKYVTKTYNAYWRSVAAFSLCYKWYKIVLVCAIIVAKFIIRLVYQSFVGQGASFRCNASRHWCALFETAKDWCAIKTLSLWAGHALCWSN